MSEANSTSWVDFFELYGGSCWRIKKVPGSIEVGQAVYLQPLLENEEFSGITTDKKAGEHIGWVLEATSGEDANVLIKRNCTAEELDKFCEYAAAMKKMAEQLKKPG